MMETGTTPRRQGAGLWLLMFIALLVGIMPAARAQDGGEPDGPPPVGLLGPVEAIDETGLTVLGIRVERIEHTYVGEENTDAEPTPLAWTDLAEGDQVGVKAGLTADGQLHALEVMRNAMPEAEVGVRGVVDAVDAETVTVLGVTFTRTDSTQVGHPEKGLSWLDIHAGDYVEVLGLADEAGLLHALFVTFDVCWDDCGGEEPPEVAVEGHIEHIVGRSIFVAGHRFLVTEETEIRGPMGGRLAFVDLKEGLPVFVAGYVGPDGLLYAGFIGVKPPIMPPDVALVGILGDIEALTDTSVTVLGLDLHLTEHTYVRVEDDTHTEGEALTVADLAVGLRVGIRAIIGPEGGLFADEVTLDPAIPGDAGVRGRVEEVDASTVVVLGIPFQRTDTTQVHPIDEGLTWDDLHEGLYVEVLAVADAEGSLHAFSVALDVCWDHCGPDDGGEDPRHKVELKGNVTAVTDGGFEVDGRPFVVVPETEFRGPVEGFTFADLKPGMLVWVVGYVEADGTHVARFVEAGIPQERIIHLSGAIQALGESTVTVRGATFVVVPETRLFDHAEQPIAFDDLRVGQIAKVVGAVGLDGVLYAGVIWAGDDEAPAGDDEEVETTVEAYGFIQTLTDSSFTVRGNTFTLLPVTRITGADGQTLTLDDLRPGLMAKVHARVGDDGVLYALHVAVRPAPSEEMDLKGTVDAVTADAIVVGGVRFALGAETEVLDRYERVITPADLKPGVIVEVHAAKRGDGPWLALQIRVRHWVNREFEAVGFIDEIEALGGRLIVLGRAFHVHPEAVMQGVDGTPISFGALQAGLLVKLHAVRLPDGALVALRIKVAADASGEIVIGGAIDALQDATLEVAGLTFVLDASTEISDRAGNALTPDDLTEGQHVAVHAEIATDGSYRELRIKRKEVVEMAGATEGVEAGVLTVQGTSFLIDENTLFLDAANNPIDASSLQPGHLVEVRGEQPETTEAASGAAMLMQAETATATRVTVLNLEGGTAVAIDDAPRTLPEAFALEQNYPNPFNPTTTIAFELAQGQTGPVALTVYNLLGQEVKMLLRGTLAAGRYEVRWDGRDAAGVPVASGVYLYRLQVGQKVQTRTMVLLK